MAQYNKPSAWGGKQNFSGAKASPWNKPKSPEIIAEDIKDDVLTPESDVDETSPDTTASVENNEIQEQLTEQESEETVAEGAEDEPDGTDEDKNEEPADKKKEPPQSKKNGSARTIIISIISVLLIAACIVGALLLINRNGESGDRAAIDSVTAETEAVTEVVTETAIPEESERDFSEYTGFWYGNGGYGKELEIVSIYKDSLTFNYNCYDLFSLDVAKAHFDGTRADFDTTVDERKGDRIKGYVTLKDGSVILDITYTDQPDKYPAGTYSFNERSDTSLMFPDDTPLWATAYYDFLFDSNAKLPDLARDQIALLYIDDNDVPELWINWLPERANNPTNLVCTFDGKDVVIKDIGANAGTFLYMERTGLFKSQDTGYSAYGYEIYETVYKIADGKIEAIGRGSFLSLPDNGGHDVGVYADFEWEGSAVDEKTYSESLGKVFDQSKSVQINEYMFDRSELEDYLVKLGAEKRERQTEETTTQTALNYEEHPVEPYMVRVTVDDLNIRSGPGTDYPISGHITDRSVYTIVAESYNSMMSGRWGKLASGAGWIFLEYTERYDEGNSYPGGLGDDGLDPAHDPFPFTEETSISGLTYYIPNGFTITDEYTHGNTISHVFYSAVLDMEITVDEMIGVDSASEYSNFYTYFLSYPTITNLVSKVPGKIFIARGYTDSSESTVFYDQIHIASQNKLYAFYMTFPGSSRDAYASSVSNLIVQFYDENFSY